MKAELLEGSTQDTVANPRLQWVVDKIKDRRTIQIPGLKTIMAILTVFLDRCENLVDKDLFGKVRSLTELRNAR